MIYFEYNTSCYLQQHFHHTKQHIKNIVVARESREYKKQEQKIEGHSSGTVKDNSMY